MSIEGVSGAGAARPLSGAQKPPKGYVQIGSTGVWRNKFTNKKDHFDAWVAGRKTAAQIEKMLNKHPDGKEFGVVPNSIANSRKGTTFELRIGNPFD